MVDEFRTDYLRTYARFVGVEADVLDRAVRAVLRDHPHPLHLLTADEALVRVAARSSGPDPELVAQAQRAVREVRERGQLIALSEWRNHLLPVDPAQIERELRRRTAEDP